MTREVARRFNQLYCGVDSHATDDDNLALGGLLPIVEAKLGRVKKLVGTGGPNNEGRLLKMSKSLNNAILLSDDSKTVQKKVMGMYTDPNRLSATDKGTIENNPLWIFHDAFTQDNDWVDEAKQRYQAGTIGDVECKRKLIDSIEQILQPMRQRRQEYAAHPKEILRILQQGTIKANEVANETLNLVKKSMKQDFFI